MRITDSCPYCKGALELLPGQCPVCGKEMWVHLIARTAMRCKGPRSACGQGHMTIIPPKEKPEDEARAIRSE